MSTKKRVVLFGVGALTAFAMVPVLWNHPARADEVTPPSQTINVATATGEEELLDVPLVGAVEEGDESEYWAVPDPETEKAHSEGLVEYLRSLGFEAEVIQIGDGYYVDTDYQDVDVLLAIEDYDWERNNWTPEAVEEHNRAQEELAAYLKGRGIECEVKSNLHGLKYADYDADDEAVIEAIWDFMHKDPLED